MKTSLAFAVLVFPAVALAQASVPPPDPAAAAAAPAAAAPMVMSPPAPAAAMTPPVAAPAPALALAGALPEEPEARIGAELSLLPFGSLKASAGGESVSADTALAMGIGGVIQHPINRTFTVEFAPRVVLNVKGDDDDQSATELDLRARVTAGGYASPSLRLYGAVQPGYSLMFLPDDAGVTSNPNGFILGLAAGATFDVAMKTKMTTEIGYQLGYQGMKVQAMDVGLRSNLLHFAVGVLVDL